MDHGSSFLRDDVPTEEGLGPGIDDDLDHPVDVSVDPRSFVLLQSSDADENLIAGGSSLLLRETDARHLRAAEM